METNTLHVKFIGIGPVCEDTDAIQKYMKRHTVAVLPKKNLWFKFIHGNTSSSDQKDFSLTVETNKLGRISCLWNRVIPETIHHEN